MKKKTIREQVAEIVVEAKIGNIWTNGPLSYADRILALIDKGLPKEKYWVGKITQKQTTTLKHRETWNACLRAVREVLKGGVK